MSTQKTHKNKQNKNKGSSIAILVFVLISLVVSITSLTVLSIQKRTLIDSGIEAQATVTKKYISTSGYNRPAMPSISYQFTTKDNQVIHSKDRYIPSNTTKQFHENESFTVTYLASDPHKNEPTKTLHNLMYFYVFFPLYFAVFGMITQCVLLLSRAILKYPRIERARKTRYGGLLFLFGFMSICMVSGFIAAAGVSTGVQFIEHLVLPG